MEEAPITEMIPKLFSLSNIVEPDTVPDRGAGDLIDQLNRNIYTLSKEGSYYMAYAADSAQRIELNLTGTNDYSLEVIDTWNMKISPVEKVSPGKFLYQTKAPFTALRLISK